jgi:hypothetical protein
MMNLWRPLALAAVVSWTLGIGVAAAQTATATNAPAGTTVELVVNAATAGSATADAAGFATIPINMAANMAGKRETDVYIFVDMCADSRRVLIAERGQQPPAPGEGCDRRPMGLFLLRRSTTLVVDVAGPNPSIRLVQGSYDPRDPRPIRAWNAAPTGLVVSAGGILAKFNDLESIACGTVPDCNGEGFDFGYALGATYWFRPFAGAEVSFVKPSDAVVTGADTGFQFTTEQDVRFLTIAGKGGIPAGPVRVYGKGGLNFHQATLTTTQINEPTTVTIDNVQQVIPGGTQTFELNTEGWGWLFGGGMEVWLKRWLGAYGEMTFNKLKGSPVDDAEGVMNDLYWSFTIGARVHVGIGR